MDYSGIKATIMGLGLNGGGLESARFMLKRGASITVTDLRDEKILKPSIDELEKSCSDLSRIRYVLGKHEIDDFKNADIVIKNPGVRPDSPFLMASQRIETDISLFLQGSRARLFAVTGTKGKSGTSSALYKILSEEKKIKGGRAFLGGNITLSPLAFLDEGLKEEDDVVLELSSFQLGDLKNKTNKKGSALLKPAAAILTSIMPDHLDRYASMEEYIDDKKNIYRGQDSGCVTIAGDDDWGKIFLGETKGRPVVCSYGKISLGEIQNGGWIDSEGKGMAYLNEETAELVPENLKIPGYHNKLNLLSASLAAFALGVKPETIRNALLSYSGIEHRLEFFHEANGVFFYNDSAATIPEASAACIEALSSQAQLVLVTGGTDKNLDFTPLACAAEKAQRRRKLRALILLAGTGSEKLRGLLAEKGVSFLGPFDNLNQAVVCAIDQAAAGDNAALSPGCASFGMFLNEFDRGRKWKEAVLRFA